MFEVNQHYELLKKANKCPDPDVRLLYVTAFYISTQAATDRMAKPFNPMLGETFEHRENGVKFICEQVSHHPPICAMVLEGEDFQLHQHIGVKTKFKVNNLELTMLGSTNIKLKGHDEYYQYEAPKAVVHNLIVGRLWIDHIGDVSVTCLSNDHKANLNFKQCGWFSKGYREVNGHIVNAKGREIFSLSGKWNKELVATRLTKSKIKVDEEYQFDKDQEYIVWKNENGTTTNPEYKKWKFTDKLVDLCEINDDLIAKLPKSDSRFRPDRICLFNKEVKKAGKEKSKIEEIQRKKRKYREKNGIEYVPKYFEKSTINDIEFWQYNGLYDKERKERIKQLKKKGKEIEFNIEFDVDNINYKEEDLPEEKSKSESEEFKELANEGEDIPLPEAEEVPDEM